MRGQLVVSSLVKLAWKPVMVIWALTREAWVASRMIRRSFRWSRWSLWCQGGGRGVSSEWHGRTPH